MSGGRTVPRARARTAAWALLGAVGVSAVWWGLAALRPGTTFHLAPALIDAIRKDPSAYYVNVHNAPFPAGAVRGQLTK